MTEPALPIDRLLHPRSIAIVGISPQPNSPGAAVLGNLERFGYRADVHLVSRNRTEVIGRPCVSTVDELPEGIDLALLFLPQAAVIDAMHACVRRKVGAAIVYAAGWAEVDDAGRAAQDELARIAREGGIALLGPNCLGIVSYVDGLALSFSNLRPAPLLPGRLVAFVSQSGGTPTVVRFALAAKSIGVAYHISVGNEALLGIEDFLGPMIADDRISVIAAFCEQIRKPQQFLAAARQARERNKRIVALHPGASEAARESARSHTGALVGDHALVRAIMESAGVVPVDTIEEMIDVIDLLIRFDAIPSRGPAMIADSGAFKAVTLDYCEQLGLPLPAFDGASVERLSAVIPAFVGTANPLDLTAQALIDTDMYANAIDAVADDTATGSTIVSGIFGSGEGGLGKVRTMIPALQRNWATRPGAIAMLVYDGDIGHEVFRECAQAGVPFFRSPERALRALGRVTRYGQFLNRPERPKRTLPPPLQLGAQGVVPEYRAKALLAAAGIAVPRGVMVTDVEAAQRAAAEIGFPVALKMQSALLAHKSDAGAIALNVADAAQLAAAWDRIHANVRAARGAVAVDGVLIEAMAKPGVELIAGARRDPAWGTTLMAGLGGVWAEVLHDTVVIPTAADIDEIVAALRKLRAAPILAGARGARPLDVLGAARALAILGSLIDATPEVAEIEINPLMLYPDGVLALDALITTS